MEKIDLNTIAQQSAIAFSISESKAGEAVELLRTAFGKPAHWGQDANHYASYCVVRDVFKTAYAEDADCSPDAANMAWSRLIALAGYSVPKAQSAGATKTAKSRAAKTEAAEKVLKQVTGKNADEVRVIAAKELNAGNVANAALLIKEAEKLGKQVISMQKEELAVIRSSITTRVKACIDKALLQKVLDMLPAVETPAATAAKNATDALKQA